MANKLKEIFSDKPIEYGFELSFIDENSIKDFQKAQESVWNEGKTVQIKGANKMIPRVKDGDKRYPILDVPGELQQVFICPASEKFNFDIKTNGVVKKIQAQRYDIKTGRVVEIPCGTGLSITIRFENNNSLMKISFNQNPAQAKSISELCHSYKEGITILEYLFNENSLNKTHPNAEKDKIKTNRFKSVFYLMHNLYEKLIEIEKEFNISFNPKDILVNDDLIETAFEIHELIIAKNVIKHRDRFKDFKMQRKAIENEEPKLSLGSEMLIAYIQETKYTLINNNILLYNAVALFNATIENIIYDEDEKVETIIYKGTDSKPLFASYSGFRNNEDALNEVSKITKDIAKYKNATLLSDYILESKHL